MKNEYFWKCDNTGFCVCRAVVEDCSSKQRQTNLRSAFASRLLQVVSWYDCSLSNT